MGFWYIVDMEKTMNTNQMADDLYSAQRAARLAQEIADDLTENPQRVPPWVMQKLEEIQSYLMPDQDNQ